MCVLSTLFSVLLLLTVRNICLHDALARELRYGAHEIGNKTRALASSQIFEAAAFSPIPFTPTFSLLISIAFVLGVALSVSVSFTFTNLARVCAARTPCTAVGHSGTTREAGGTAGGLSNFPTFRPRLLLYSFLCTSTGGVGVRRNSGHWMAVPQARWDVAWWGGLLGPCVCLSFWC